MRFSHAKRHRVQIIVSSIEKMMKKRHFPNIASDTPDKSNRRVYQNQNESEYIICFMCVFKFIDAIDLEFNLNSNFNIVFRGSCIDTVCYARDSTFL